MNEAPVERLEARWRQVAGASEPDALARAGAYRALERDLAVESSEGGGGRVLLLHAAARWRDHLLERDLAAAGAAEEVVDALVSDEAALWRAPAPLPEDPDALFRAMAEVSAIDRAALERRAGPPLLRDALPPLRAALAEAIARRPPDAATRRRWAVELADRADALLTGLEGVPPERARARLELVAEEIAWHLRHVERDRGKERARLSRRLFRLRAEGQERALRATLERRHGARAVRRLDRTIHALIVLVLAILAFEWIASPPRGLSLALSLVDASACAVFLAEFFYKLALVRGRALWFARHLFVDLLPSIPFMLLTHHVGADPVRAGRLLRLARVSRPLRVLGFLSRGLDRLARASASLLDRDVVVFPTPEERRRGRREADARARRVWRLHADIDARWRELLARARPEEREAVALARVDGLAEARARHSSARSAAAPAPPREVLAEDLLRSMEALTPEELEARAGPELVPRAARAVRLLSRAPFRWLPILRRFVPRLGEDDTDAEAVVAAARKSAAELRRHHDRVFWFADLFGTVTPAQFVDRVGTVLVKGAFRPAFRLTLAGLFLGLLEALIVVAGLEALLGGVRDFLGRFATRPLVALGGICFVVFGIGLWMKRVAGSYSTFFSQVARAQHLGLTETIKARFLDHDAEVLERRVLRAEALARGEAGEGSGTRFAAKVRRWLQADPPPGARIAGDPLERVLMLYLDGLDGGLLTLSDTRATSQLLGDPALANLRARSRRVGARERKELARLDLERQTSAFSGPYLWFSMICDALEQGAARGIVEYNRNALPLVELARASDEEAARHAAWLRAASCETLAPGAGSYVTSAFHALHFLDDDPARDREVESAFGPHVLARLRADRRRLFRRVFGTYPHHRKPREARVLNPMRLFSDRLAGGRALLLPGYVAAAAARGAWRFLRGVRRCLVELRHPTPATELDAAAEADFATAERKIARMRLPVVEACLLLRARFDPEYLGVRLPGCDATGLEGGDAGADLEFLRAGAALRERVAAERRRAERDLWRLSELLRGGLLERVAARLGVPAAELGREHLRAAACAYLADFDGVRSALSGREVLEEVFAAAARKTPPPRLVLLPRRGLRAAFGAWWRARPRVPPRARRAAWRALLADAGGAQEALLEWRRLGEGARAEGERRLAALLRHPERISDPLVALRTVQTIAMLDVLAYRRHVWRLGGYAEEGDDPGAALALG